MAHSLLLLPGNDPRQREWIHSVGTELADLFSRWDAVEYLHWEDPHRGGIDFAAELQRIGSRKISVEQLVVFAKSVGIVLALMATSQGLLKPSALIFVGFPLSQFRESSFPVAQSLRALSAPILFVQNGHDPYCSGKDLAELLTAAELAGYDLVILPGESHHYPDLVAIREAVERFLPKAEP
jgi:pimeloyl-ACP methyl ester carboxylesterase